MEKLKRCPFCGKDTGYTFSRQIGASGDHRVECIGCGAKTGLRKTLKGAIAAWNRRPGLLASAEGLSGFPPLCKGKPEAGQWHA